MNEIIQRGMQLMDFVSSWFTLNIFGSADGFIKAILNLMIAVLSFTIDIIKWLIGRI